MLFFDGGLSLDELNYNRCTIHLEGMELRVHYTGTGVDRNTGSNVEPDRTPAQSDAMSCFPNPAAYFTRVESIAVDVKSRRRCRQPSGRASLSVPKLFYGER